MITIGFVGNCQLLSLCFYTQFLLKDNPEYTVRYVCYDNSFHEHLDRWSDKCHSKILDYSEGIDYLMKCDYIIYNKIKDRTSVFFNADALQSYAKPSCVLVSITSIFIELDKYQTGVSELLYRDIIQCNTIKVSTMIYEYMKQEGKQLSDLLITKNHPTTYLFMVIMEELCNIMGLKPYGRELFNTLVQNRNLMELPLC